MLNFTSVSSSKYIVFILCFASQFNISAQHDVSKMYSEKTRIYNLDSAQFLNLYKNIPFDSVNYLSSFYTDFYTDSSFDFNQLPYGHYLVMNANYNTAKYGTHSNSYFKIKSYGYNGETWVLISDPQDEIVEKAQVTLKGESYSYQEDCGCYPIPGKKANGLLKVSFNEHYDFMQLNSNKPPRSKYETEKTDNKPDYTSSNIRILPGYVATNKPLYRLGDTVKVKAFLLDYSGKPLKRKVKIKVYDNRNLKFITPVIKIKPTSAGAYIHEFYLDDSLSIDNDYTIQYFSANGGVLFKNHVFRIEDYNLEDKYFYSVRAEKNLFRKGEKVNIWLRAQDVNGLPVLDAKAIVRIRTLNLDKYYNNRFYHPDEWSIKQFERTYLLDVAGETKIELPDLLFPDVRMQYQVDVNFVDSKNRSEIRNTSFVYDAIEAYHNISLFQDSIHVNYIVLGEIEEDEVYLKVYSGNQILSQKKISLPYSESLELIATRYEIYKNEKLITSYDTPNRPEYLIFPIGQRSHDSIQISFHNDLGPEISYKVYKKDVQVSGGRSKSPKFDAYDISIDSYHLVYSFVWQGQFYIKEASFHIREKSLKVVADFPKTVYPGASIPVELSVLDFRNEPVKDVNLTGLAYNAKFENIIPPDLPYFGIVHHDLLTNFGVTIVPISVSGSNYLTLELVSELDLRKTAFYSLLYPKDGVGVHEDSSGMSGAVLQPYIYENKFLQRIYSVYINNQPVYISGLSVESSQVFRYKPGKAKIAIRTGTKFYEVENVELKEGMKTILCLNHDILSSNKVKITKMDSIPYKNIEIQILEPSIMWLQNASNESLYLEQDSSVIYAARFNGRAYSSVRNEGVFYYIGPFKRGNINVFNKSSDTTYSFYYEPGFMYKIVKDTVKALEKPEENSLFQRIYPYNINPQWNFNVQPIRWPHFKKDVLYVAPEVETKNGVVSSGIIHQRLIKTAYPKKSEPSLHCMVNLESGANKDVYAILFENRKNDSASSVWFTSAVQSYMLPGIYDLEVWFADSTYKRYSDVDFKAGGKNYMRIDDVNLNPYSPEELNLFFDKVVELNKAPLTPFTQYPMIVKDYKLRYLPSKTKKTIISGYVIDVRNYPIQNAVIYAEVDGVFREGAVTNRDGYFEIHGIGQANYMLKIIRYGQNPITLHNVKTKKGLNTHLVVKETKTEYQETLDEIVLTEDQLIEVGKTSNVTISQEEIHNMPMRSTNSIASMTPGISYEVESMSIRGARSSSDMVFIDGVKVRGDANIPRDAVSMQEVSISGLPANYGEVQGGAISMNNRLNYDLPEFLREKGYTPEEYEALKSADSEMMQQMSMDSMANRVRNNFRDYAFWIPNLITDKEGKSYFTVDFPDNVTKWKAFFPAVSRKKQTGMGLFEIGSFKPVSANLGAPKYLVDGDEITIHGKTLNYTGDSLKSKHWFEINGDSLQSKTIVLNSLNDQKLQYKAKEGSLELGFMLELENGYFDGERRTIDIKSRKIDQHKVEVMHLNGDTSFVMFPQPGVDRSIFVSNDALDMFKKEIEYLKNYEYGCNEQTASKLIALLTEKKMKEVLGEPFEDERVIRRCIRILEKNQNYDGSYGWWGPSQTDDYITGYVLAALNFASENGYNSKAKSKCAAYLSRRVDKVNTSTKLSMLLNLFKTPYPLDYANYIKKIDTLTLNFQDELRLTHLKQLNGEEVELDSLLDLAHRSKRGMYWGESFFSITVNKWETSKLVYDILRMNKEFDSDLKEIRRYFLSDASPDRNTIFRAGMLLTFADDILEAKSSRDEVTGALYVNGRKIEKLPFSYDLSENDTLAFRKTGDAMQFYFYRNEAVENPVGIDSILTVKSEYYFKGKPVSNFQLGDEVIVSVDVKLKEDVNYALIEIPIPAGFVYNNNPYSKNYNETQRERFRDKTVIAVRILKKGRHQFQVPLTARFEGSFHSLPVKVSDMYFPVRSNYTEPKLVEVIKN